MGINRAARKAQQKARPFQPAPAVPSVVQPTGIAIMSRGERIYACIHGKPWKQCDACSKAKVKS